MILLSLNELDYIWDGDPEEDLLHLFFNKIKLKECPKCGWSKPFTRTKKKRSFHCTRCAYQIFPYANTIFEKSKIGICWWIIFWGEIVRNPDVSIHDLRSWTEVDKGKYCVSYDTVYRIRKIILSQLKGDDLIITKRTIPDNSNLPDMRRLSKEARSAISLAASSAYIGKPNNK